MRNRLTKDLCSNDATGVPEHTGMHQQEIASRGVVHLQVGCHGKQILQVEQRRWGIVLAHAVRQEAVNSDAENYDLRPGALPEEALQSVEPVVIARGLQENGIHTDPRSNQVRTRFVSTPSKSRELPIMSTGTAAPGLAGRAVTASAYCRATRAYVSE